MNPNPSNPENGDHLSEKDLQNENNNNLDQDLVQSQLNENQRHDQAENEEMLQPENDNLMENIPADDIPQNQDHPDDQAEEELQQNQDEEENNNAAAPAENTIASLISSVSNSHLMSEENIEAIREVLCKKENVFYKLSPRDENLQEELQAIIKWKAKIAENTIGQALNYYHQKLLDSELNHLDKLMRILKSNRREMYLRRLPAESHEHDEPNEENDNPDASPSQQERISGIGGNNGSHHENAAINKASKGKNVTLRDLLPEYDPQKKFIRFQLNDKYEVYLKAFEQKGVRKGSLIDRIPQDVLQNHIFIYFNSFDLFKIRAVCSEWREFIRGMWHIIFRREMMEQVIAADLCNDIEMNFKLMGVKSPFYQKFGIFMKAISEIIDWDVFLGSLQTDTVDLKVKMLVITFFRMIGMYVGFDRLSDYDEVYWNHFKEIASNHLKTFIDSLFHQEFQFKSNYELDLVKENFLDCPDISSFSVRQSDDKNAIMFQLFLRQLLVFAQLKNYISLAQSYIIMAKDKLKEVSKEWPHKKDFLEGAYKILLFKFIEIRNGEVTIVKEDSDRRSGLLRNIQDELDECMHITTRIHEQSDQNHGDSEQNTFSQGTQSVELSKQVEPSSSLEESKEGYGELGQVNDKEETLGTLIANEFDQKLKQEQHDSNRIQEENLNEGDRVQEQASNEIPEAKPSVKCAYHDDTRNRFDLEGQLAKIIELKNNSSDIAYEKFIKSQDPDYVIKRNGSETRLYLDDLIKVEFLIQKVLKQHLIRQKTECSCPAHADENIDENDEENEGNEEEVVEGKEDVIQVSEQENNDNENQPL